jgi:hypothetical protein
MKILVPPLNFYLLMLILILTSCNTQSVSHQSLMTYVNDESNGLLKIIEHSDSKVKLCYTPHDLILAQEVKGSDYTESQIDSIRNKLAELDYFKLSLSQNGEDIINQYASNPTIFNKAVEYLSYNISKDLKLIHNHDTLNVLDVMYSSGFGLNKSSEVLMVFESSLSKKQGDVQILFNDEFFRTGLNQFEFKIDAIKSVPTLAINK